LPETFVRAKWIGLYIIKSNNKLLSCKRKQIQQKKLPERIVGNSERANNKFKNGIKTV
jgi:hypothetical protein